MKKDSPPQGCSLSGLLSGGASLSLKHLGDLGSGGALAVAGPAQWPSLPLVGSPGRKLGPVPPCPPWEWDCPCWGAVSLGRVGGFISPGFALGRLLLGLAAAETAPVPASALLGAGPSCGAASWGGRQAALPSGLRPLALGRLLLGLGSVTAGGGLCLYPP